MTDAQTVVDRYLTLANGHDRDGCLQLLSDTFELQFADSEYVMTKDAIATALGWDAGVSGHLEYQIVKSDDREITVEGHESNDFLKLIGINSLSFRSKFTVSEDGQVERQYHDVDWGTVTMETAMKPLIDWAEKEAPDELEQIYPNGAMVYTEAAARRWVALAERWRRTNR